LAAEAKTKKKRKRRRKKNNNKKKYNEASYSTGSRSTAVIYSQ